MYITHSYSLGLVWLGLVSSVLVSAGRSSMSLLCGAVEDDGVGDSGDGGFFSGTSWRFVFLCSVSGGRRRRFEEDGSRSSFFDISDGFIVLAGDNCFRFVYQLVGKPGWVLFPTFFGGSDPLREDCHPVCWVCGVLRRQIPRNLVMRWPRAIFLCRVVQRA